MRFRRKPIEIEARQWLGGDYAWLNGFCGQNWTRADALEMAFDDPEQIVIYNTASRQWLYVLVGHWIVRGLQGELYPCKPDIFLATHEQLPPICLQCNGTGKLLIKTSAWTASTEECSACNGAGLAPNGEIQ